MPESGKRLLAFSPVQVQGLLKFSVRRVRNYQAICISFPRCKRN